MYKVFINDRSIELTDNFEDYASSYDTLFINFGSEQAFYDSIDLVINSDVVKKLVVYSNDLNTLWTSFNKRYKCIKAAGGIVIRKGKVLMIYKKGFWDLPKGKIDGKESTEGAAIREVSEECGLNNLSITNELPKSHHLFQEKGEWLIKETCWFEMSSETEGPLMGDAKEGITEVKWVNKDAWKEVQTNSYASVIQMLESIF